MAILKKKIKKPAKVVKKQITALSARSYSVLIRPYISQKAASQAGFNQSVFEVCLSATKKEVKDAIKEIFGLKPIKVNFIKIRAKTVRFGLKTGKRRKKKKAIAIFKLGDKLDVLANV